MQKNKTLVEVGHIYLDETLSSYHQKPIDIYKNLYKECDVILMVDDLIPASSPLCSLIN